MADGGADLNNSTSFLGVLSLQLDKLKDVLASEYELAVKSEVAERVIKQDIEIRLLRGELELLRGQDSLDDVHALARNVLTSSASSGDLLRVLAGIEASRTEQAPRDVDPLSSTGQDGDGTVSLPRPPSALLPCDVTIEEGASPGISTVCASPSILSVDPEQFTTKELRARATPDPQPGDFDAMLPSQPAWELRSDDESGIQDSIGSFSRQRTPEVIKPSSAPASGSGEGAAELRSSSSRPASALKGSRPTSALKVPSKATQGSPRLEDDTSGGYDLLDDEAAKNLLLPDGLVGGILKEGSRASSRRSSGVESQSTRNKEAQQESSPSRESRRKRNSIGFAEAPSIQEFQAKFSMDSPRAKDSRIQPWKDEEPRGIVSRIKSAGGVSRVKSTGGARGRNSTGSTVQGSSRRTSLPDRMSGRMSISRLFGRTSMSSQPDVVTKQSTISTTAGTIVDSNLDDFCGGPSVNKKRSCRKSDYGKEHHGFSGFLQSISSKLHQKTHHDGVSEAKSRWSSSSNPRSSTGKASLRPCDNSRSSTNSDAARRRSDKPSPQEAICSKNSYDSTESQTGGSHSVGKRGSWRVGNVGLGSMVSVGLGNVGLGKLGRPELDRHHSEGRDYSSEVTTNISIGGPDVSSYGGSGPDLSNYDSFEDGEFDNNIDDRQEFEVDPMWRIMKKRKAPMKLDELLQPAPWFQQIQEECQKINAAPRWTEKFVVHPNSARRVFWELVGCLLILYDCWFVPLQVFDLPQMWFTLIVSWLSRIFWTLDIAAGFCTTYIKHDGAEERDLLKVIYRYLRTWFLPDVFVVSFEWLEVFLQENTVKAHTLIKAFRFVRAVRIFRLSHRGETQVMRQFNTMIRSEELILVADIFRIMVVLAMVIHSIACLWVYVGTRGNDHHVTWLSANDLQTAPAAHKYAVSYHWSLAQFTGTDSIAPQSHLERATSILIVFPAYVMSACLISSITSAMTRLQIITANTTRQQMMLRRYLSEHGISQSLAARVQRNAQHSIAEQKRNTPEESVELLSVLSKPLRVELDYEVHSRVLKWHPFFRLCDNRNPAGMRQVCHQAVSRLVLTKDDMLFCDGETPAEPRMFFLVRGSMLYRHIGNYGDHVTYLTEGDWACEPVLWTSAWNMHGQMVAYTDSGLLCINANKFRSTVNQFNLGGSSFAGIYAREFVSELNKFPEDMLSEVYDSTWGIHVGDIVDICEEFVETNARQSARFSARNSSALVSRNPSTQPSARTSNWGEVYSYASHGVNKASSDATDILDTDDNEKMSKSYRRPEGFIDSNSRRSSARP